MCWASPLPLNHISSSQVPLSSLPRSSLKAGSIEQRKEHRQQHQAAMSLSLRPATFQLRTTGQVTKPPPVSVSSTAKQSLLGRGLEGWPKRTESVPGSTLIPYLFMLKTPKGDCVAEDWPSSDLRNSPQMTSLDPMSCHSDGRVLPKHSSGPASSTYKCNQS